MSDGSFDRLRADAPIGRARFLGWGFGLFALKYNLDRLVAYSAFDRKWGVLEYLNGEMTPQDLAFGATLVALALPFVAIGTLLTLRRLRTVGLPPWLVALFFVPVVNLLLFALLGALPDRSLADAPLPDERPSGWARHWLDALPRSREGSAAVAVLAVSVMGVLLTALSAQVLSRYGFGLFVGLPFALGFAAALLHGYHTPRSFGSCLSVATLSVVFAGILLFVLIIEGVFCLFMVAPLAIVLSWIGATVGYFVQRRPPGPTAPVGSAALLFLVVPALMGFEAASPEDAIVLPVVTTIDVDAPAERVWRHVVAFPRLSDPEEWYFRGGIAYPIGATIDGKGVGAVRRCEFSTGTFVEPIRTWDAPRRLAFSVSAQPRPMTEFTWGPHLDARHLDGYLQSTGGEFLITPLPDGRSRLRGTTWYRHALWPELYWRLWSDAVIHRIHLRVLSHVKALAEARG